MPVGSAENTSDIPIIIKAYTDPPFQFQLQT